MTFKDDENYVYIVLSQTGTMPSRLLKRITKKDYNHVSLSLSPSLESLYSFGRRLTYYPFWGGFIMESFNKGTFNRFPEADIMVLRLAVSQSTFCDIYTLISKMQERKYHFKYNYRGLFLAYFKVYRSFKNRFYCSEFVKYALETNGVLGAGELCDIVEPTDFLSLPNCECIYKGKLNEFKLSA